MPSAIQMVVGMTICISIGLLDVYLIRLRFPEEENEGKQWWKVPKFQIEFIITTVLTMALLLYYFYRFG